MIKRARVTIIVPDKVVTVDGNSLELPDEEFPADVHAVQWYGETGEIEWADMVTPNTTITNLEQFAPLLKAFDDLLAALKAQIAEEEAQIPPEEQV